MEWNTKTPSWDLTEFTQEPIPNIDTISVSGGHGNKGDCSVDLKLGQMAADSGNKIGENLKVTNAPKMVLSPSGSSKRTRAAINNNGIQIASCLVDGCSADLSKCREYHRRHKVCELHSKTAQVTINGHKQRFCQQCSRFHSLEEFDEGKRSCRKRLDGHNRRRRKPQPEPLSHAGSFFCGNQGVSRLLQFSTAQVYPTTAVVNPIWAGIVNADEDVKLYNQQTQSHLSGKHNVFLESSSSSDKRGKQFSFLDHTNLELSNQTAAEASVCQPLLNTFASSGNGGSGNKLLRDGFSTRALHSDCALSLLSSSSSPTQTSDNSLSHAMQANSVPKAHPSNSGLRYTSLEPMESYLVPSVSDADDNCQGVFQMEPQKLPFYWE